MCKNREKEELILEFLGENVFSEKEPWKQVGCRRGESSCMLSEWCGWGPMLLLLDEPIKLWIGQDYYTFNNSLKN